MSGEGGLHEGTFGIAAWLGFAASLVLFFDQSCRTVGLGLGEQLDAGKLG